MPALASEAPAPYVDRMRVETIEGNHWVVAQGPGEIAGLIQDFIAAVETGTLSQRSAHV